MNLRAPLLLAGLGITACAGGWACGGPSPPNSPAVAHVPRDDTDGRPSGGDAEASDAPPAAAQDSAGPADERDCLETVDVERTRHLLGAFLIGGLLDGLAHSDELLSRFERDGAAERDIELLVGRIASLRHQEQQLMNLLVTTYRSDTRRERDQMVLPVVARAIAAHEEALGIARTVGAKGGPIPASMAEAYRRARQAFDDEVARVVASTTNPPPSRDAEPRP